MVFGTTARGEAVEAVPLAAGRLSACVLTCGAILKSVRLDGVAHDLTLGSDRLADYEDAMRYHGAVVGPVANRLRGAKAVIGGRLHAFEANEGGNTLHSGATGVHARVWTLDDAGPSHAALSLDLPDGLGGFPGQRRLTARFEALPPATLRLTLAAATDAPTLMNLANHCYWTLDGTDDVTGHRLRIAADRYLTTRPDGTPRGAIRPVGGTPMDFRRAQRLAPGAPPLDTCFCLGDRREPLREVLWLEGRSGVTLTLATTEPGVQVYDARDACRPGRGPYEGLALEPQYWPDAPANPGFPSILLDPGQDWTQVTEWRFAGP